MKKPANLNLPFFAYGIFKPGQLGFFQLRGIASKIMEPSHIAGALRIRDGLPIVDPNGNRQIKGALLHFATPDAACEAYERISRLEPDQQYIWGEALANGGQANVLLGKSPLKGSVECEGDDWDGWNDPLFTSALDVVEEIAKSNSTFEWDLKPLFRLQMAYLLLWSAIERYVSLRYYLGDKAAKKVNHLASESSFGASLKKNVTERRELFRADRPGDKVILDPQDPKKALGYYYQVRSNITHRGKAVTLDHDRILASLTELLEIFRGVLKAARGDASSKV